MRKIINKLLSKIGYKLIKKYELDLLYLHEYEGGYDQYINSQIHHNKRKIDYVWADKNVLLSVSQYLKTNLDREKISGICHGARNGYEVKWFKNNINGNVFGTDISETAINYPDMVVWDFHKINKDWINKFDFIYTNSLDHSIDPKLALDVWIEQIKNDGYIFIEHTLYHRPQDASEMDPFGAHPMIMPYLFFKWGRGKYYLKDIIEIDRKSNYDISASIFVLCVEN